MIRIYLDWNVISNFKREEFSELRDFIATHKDILQFPYTPTHFKDLMKSYKVGNDFFEKDLKNLEYLSKTHLLRWEKDKIEVLSALPSEYFEEEKDNIDEFAIMDFEKILSELDSNDLGIKIGTQMKELLQLLPSGIEINDENKEMLQKIFPEITLNSSVWDLINSIIPFYKKLSKEREYYKDLRKSIGDQGFRLEANAGNWNIEDVIDNIDDFLQKQDTKQTFTEYVDNCLKHKKEPVNRFEYYTTAYLLLDMMGYKSDKLPKSTDNMQNIQNDSQHSFYAAHCDYFVATDKNLLTKTKVLYKKFNISTEILPLDKLVETLKSKIHVPDLNENFINEALKFLVKGEIVESYPKTDTNIVDTHAYKLPIFYFNFFNYAIIQNYSEQHGFVLTFKKVFKNYSNFIFFTETGRLVDNICKHFGITNEEEFLEKKKEFIYGDKEINFTWRFDNSVVTLEKDIETYRPVLTYVVALSQ